MENVMFWFVLLFAALTLYRLVSQKMAVTPKGRVTAMLRRYRALEKSGLSERDCLLQLLATRTGWTRLPRPFLAEVVTRLRSKEDVMRFISVSEDYRYHRDHYPRLAAETDAEAAMAKTASLFSRFGFRLQEEGRLKEAEFMQKLAWLLQPQQYFTNLPLAATYHDTGRHADALPLFERGLERLKDMENDVDAGEPQMSPAECLGYQVEMKQLRNRYQKMYKACLKAAK